MAEYQCTHCEDSFDHPGPGKPRCPRCLRTNGLLPAGEAAAPEPEAPRSRRKILWIMLGVSALALAAGAGLFLHKRATDLPLPGQLGALDTETLRLTLTARGLPAGTKSPHPLQGGEAVAALAGEAPKAKDAAGQAAAIATTLAGRASRAKPLFNGPPTWNARAPEDLLKALAGKDPVQLTSLELASLLVAMLRAADLPAVLAERFHTPAPGDAPDPSGFLGRYLAVVYPPGKLGSEPVARLDPLLGLKLPEWATEEPASGSMGVSSEDVIPLGDASAAAHLMSQRALAAAVKEPERAYRLSRAALATAAPSATLMLARAQVLAAAGGLKDAVGAARKAVAARDDAPRQAGLARLLLMSGNPDSALAVLRQAVKVSPGFWPARQLLASLLGRMDPEKAEEHLLKGLEIAPEEPGLLLLDGAWRLSRGLPGQAAERLGKVAAALPGNLDVKLMLYHALKQSSQPEAAAAVRKELLARAEKREEMERRLKMIDQAPVAPEGGAVDPAPGGATPGPMLKLPDVSLGK